MKKEIKNIVKLIILFIILFTSLLLNNNQREDIIIFNYCIDGDTFNALIDNNPTTIRLLAVDTPEYTKKKEPFGKESSEYTCVLLQNAKQIKIEYDDNSNLTDKYKRTLGWIIIDENLLQLSLIKKGYAEVKYLYGDYKYTTILKEAEKKAKNGKIGIWEQ
ncbi:MAG: thermonuclease family protein [Bacilli bacterium]|jgi:micrococcal nuclease